MYQTMGACGTVTQQRRRQLQRLLYVLLFGFLAGIIWAMGFPETSWSVLLDQGFSEQEAYRSLWDMFLGAFLPTFGLFLCCMLLGLSAFGQAGSLLVLLYRGMGLGIAASHSYLTWGIQGLPVVLFLQLPYSGATCFLLLLAVREAWRLSSRFGVFLRNQPVEEGESLRYYWIRFFVLTMLLLLAAAGDCALTYFLSGFLIGGLSGAA